MSSRSRYGIPEDDANAERFTKYLMSHEAPRAPRRRSQRRPLSLKPPICDDCGQWLAPNFDHSACKSA